MQILKLTQANERSHERAAQIAHELQELADQVADEQRQLQEISERKEFCMNKLLTIRMQERKHGSSPLAGVGIARAARTFAKGAE